MNGFYCTSCIRRAWRLIQIAISVKNALQLPIMKQTNLVAGFKGIENNIKWVTIVEILEDFGRLQEGEFLITTGFELLEDEERMEVFHNLFKSKLLSGVAIYTSFYMEKIPESLIDLANKNDLPLIEIPTDINFSKITKAILEQIVNKQMHLLEQSEKIHRELTDLILNDQSLMEVTARLAQLTSSKIVIYNEFYEIMYWKDFHNHHMSVEFQQTFISVNEERIDLSKHLLTSLDKESKVNLTVEHYIFTIYPIIAKQSCFGWIILAKKRDQWQELDDLAIERATTIYAMEFLKKQAVEETQLRIQSNLLEDIFSKNYLNERIIKDQALKLNYDLSLNQAVFHLTFKDLKKIDMNIMDRLYHMTEQMLIQKNKQHIIQTKLHSIIFLTNVVGETKEATYNHCASLANDLWKEWNFYFPKIELMIGIGRDYDLVDHLGKSGREAQYAVQLGELVNPKTSIIHYHDLGMYDLLLEMKRTGINLTAIYEENISGLLKESDKEIDLIETIEVYFKNNQSIQQSAEKLFIHRHTLRYRLNQIEQRTGLDLKGTDDLLKLQLGVMAYKLATLLEKNEQGN